MTAVRRLAVFTGSASGTDPTYAAAAATLGRHLAEAGIGIVYGGAHVGLMGAVADAALAAGGEVIGVMPKALVDREIDHTGLTELITCGTMHERKAAMADRADAFVALPGGAGTLEEIFEVWTWQQIGYHAKPVAFYDTGGYWQGLLTALAEMADAGFMRQPYLDSLVVESEPAALVAALTSWTPPPETWMAPGS